MFRNRETGQVSRYGSKVFTSEFSEHAPSFPNVPDRTAIAQNVADHIAVLTGEMLPYGDVVSWS